MKVAPASTVVQKEIAIHEHRHWVRISRVCNQTCTFCLDADLQNGTFVSLEECKREIERGRTELHAERLILSGGEASIHPHFDTLIAYGRSLGYSHVQTVTNGEMFSRARFAKKVVDAGLGEVTFSIHGHTPALHDSLVQKQGAFMHAVRGITNLRLDGRCIVNMDIVINKQNYRHLPHIIEFFVKLGIHEFDLLYIVPFGRAMHEDFKDSLFMNPYDVVPYVQKALALQDKYGLYVWTNRLPVELLENFESFIQDPHKMVDEANGRRPMFEDVIARDRKPDCFGEACDHCFVRRMCHSLQDVAAREKSDGFPFVEIDLLESPWVEGVEGTAFRLLAQAKQWKVRAGKAGDLAPVLDWGAPPEGLVLEIEDYEGFIESIPSSLLPLVDRVILKTREHLETAGRDIPGVTAEVEVNRETAPWFGEDWGRAKRWLNGLSFRVPNHNKVTLSYDHDVDLPVFFGGANGTPFTIQNVAPCLAEGKNLEPRRRWFPLNILREDGFLHQDRFVEHFITDGYYAKSSRCRQCAHQGSCEGMHINFLRHFGFKVMKPVGDRTNRRG